MKEEEEMQQLQSKIDDIGVYIDSFISNDMSTATWYKLTIARLKIEEASAALGDRDD